MKSSIYWIGSLLKIKSPPPPGQGFLDALSFIYLMKSGQFKSKIEKRI